jgi:hypothetical protein
MLIKEIIKILVPALKQKIMFVHTAPTLLYLLVRRLRVISFYFFYLERGLNCDQLPVSIIVNAPGTM